MASDGEGSVGSDDDDDGFDEDFEALRRACLLAGTNPTDFREQCPSAITPLAAPVASVDTQPGSDADGGDDDDDDDDLALARDIQKRFAIVTDAKETATFQPLRSLPPWEDDKEDGLEDDFETLRAIQRRFVSYSERTFSGDGLKNSSEIVLYKPELGGVTNLALEVETSNNQFVESSNAEEDPSFVGKINNTSDSESHSNLETRAGPSDTWQDSSAGDGVRLPLGSSTFPKAAEAFVDAIKKNRSCQKLIRSKLLHIESRIEELKSLRERVKILRDFQFSCKRRTGRALSQKKDPRAQLISASKITPSSKPNEKKPSPTQYGPAENPQVAKFREAVEKSPALMGRAKWSKEESEKLVNGLKQQFQELLLQRSLDLISGEDWLDESSGHFDGVVASIGDVEIAPEKMRQFLPKVNWEYLASMYLPGRSGAECQSRWLNYEDPLINQSPWTSKEDKILLHVVQQKGLSNWIDITKSVGTNRTPFQCLSRYQRSLNASIIKREWTEEEDDQLRAAVEAYGESNWQIVASAMEGRTGTQCSNRWMKTLHPARQRVGRWSADEDKRLKVAVMLFGPKNWKKIAEFVPGRTQVQCRERWVNSLDPSLNLDSWTEEEDSKLKEAIELHGCCWSKVAACVPPRTDSQCRRRWKVLLPHQVPLLRAAREMQKAALISNFVDRESERPALRPDDFVPSQELLCSPESEHVSLSGKRNGKRKRGFRHRREDALANPCSRDLCSKEVPGAADGTEGEALTNNLVSSNRRRKRHLKKTKSIASAEEHLPCGQGLTESVSTKTSEKLEISGAVSCCPGRDDQETQDPETVSRDMSKSEDTGSLLGCNEPQSEKHSISTSYHLLSRSGDDILVEKQMHEAKSGASETHKSADDAAHRLSSSSTPKMYSRRCLGGSKTLRGSRKRGRIISEDADDDDLTLAAFYEKKLAAAADTRDDDMTLASFCSKLKKKKIKFAEQVE